MTTSVKLPAAYFTIATAGHVDHGKTSLIKALTGINPDRLKEEQERQMTTDLVFAHLLVDAPDAPGKSTLGLGFIDVPGHGKFIKNMLAGVGGIELALLVVAADEGPMPQTVQHVKILSLLGVRSAVVALTKLDLVDAARCSAVEAKVRALLARYHISVAGLEFVSSVKGENGPGIAELKKALALAVASFNPASVAAASNAAGYLPIDRVFAKSGYGTVVTGTLVEGAFRVGDQVMIEPGHIAARIRGLETFGQTQEVARAGQRLAINLSAKEHKLNLSRGLCVLAGTKNVTSDLFVRIVDYGAENDSEPDGARKARLSPKPIKLYHGTMEAAGALRWIEQVGDVAVGHIHLSDAIVVSPGDRYVLRYGDDGIAGGEVLLCQKPRWLTRKYLIQLAPLLVQPGGDLAKALLNVLQLHPGKALHADQLGWVVRDALLAQTLAKLGADKQVENISGFVMATGIKEGLKEKTLATLKAQLKSEEAIASGVNLETIRRLVAPHLDRRVMQELIKELAQAGLLVRKDDKIFGPQGGAQPSATLDAYTTSVMKVLNGVLCLEITEIGKLTGSDPKKVRLAVERLAKLDLADVINYDFASSKRSVDEAHRKLLKIWQAKKDISPADFRDELATTRKYALALLAYFDDHQVTRRTANGRALLKQPK
ncbi:MAG: selenocysteine-specific translation elongation factor [Cyanobacteria bacterium SZAS TMP-1]|nr:selenocysteine-specific translation elongation factor [Cyanobacteria bacterium SZAS TMP-1]